MTTFQQASLPVSDPDPASVKAATGRDYTPNSFDHGYTLTEYIARLKVQAAEQMGPTGLEQAIMKRLQGYGLFLAERCFCGCRLKWRMAGGMYIVCARCEQGGLWSDEARKMLNRKGW